MREIKQIRFSGFGGQGIILAGTLLGQAGVIEGKYAAGANSYGAQARGSACTSEIVFANNPIDYPLVITTDIMVAMSQGAYDMYFEEVREPFGLIIYDSGLLRPLRFIGRRGKAVGIEFKRLGLVKKSTFKVYTDTIITAIGQEVDRKALRGLEVNPDGTVRTDQKTGETSMRGVFAGGDVVTGPGWAINAIAAGKKGAEYIHKYLS